jgi:hypothetical protein
MRHFVSPQSVYRIALFTVCLSILSAFLQNKLYAQRVPSAQEGPVIEISSHEHDFGQVSQGLKLTHDFMVKNSGNQDLIIRELNPSCGCTAAVLEDPVLKPGMETSIRVSFDTAGFTGSKVKTVRVYSNDPGNASLVLRVKADIVPEIFTEPSKVEIFNVRRGEEVSIRFLVKSVEGIEVPLKDIISKSDFVIVSSEINEHGEVEVTASTSPDIPPGKLRTRIVIRTSNPRVPVINVPVIIDVVRDIVIEPKSVNFGYFSEGVRAPVSRKLLISRAKGTPEGVKAVKASSGSKSVSVNLEVAEDETQQLIVSLLPGSEGVIRGYISLEISHPDPAERIIEIPIYAVIDNEK